MILRIQARTPKWTKYQYDEAGRIWRSDMRVLSHYYFIQRGCS